MLKKTTVKEQTYRYLKEKILAGDFKQGERINVEQLTEQLDVSNTPIREAISMLDSEGLIKVDTNYGIKVVELTDRDIIEIVNCIVILVIGGYKLCIEQAKIHELISKMESCLNKQKRYLEIGDNRKFLEYSIKFDENLVIVPGNKKLISILNNLNDLFYLVVRDFQRTQHNRSTSISDHIEMLNIINKGQPVDVETVINQHYAKSLTFILEHRNSLTIES